jgi:hypothetical protein
MSERHGPVALQPAPPTPGWPPDDTEDSVLGTNLHQATITHLRTGLNDVASLLAPSDQPPPWQALSQTGISGLRRWDGSEMTVLPDVFVYDRPVDERLATLPLLEYGPPLLVVEVLSPTTRDSDLDLRHGKGYSYAQAGVLEYLILDPEGTDLPEQGQGWRLEGSGYVPWRREASGRWQSQVIPVAVAFEGTRLVVFGPEGQRQLREGEVAREVARLRELAQEAARLREEVARLREENAVLRRYEARLARLEAELGELRRRLEQREEG